MGDLVVELGGVRVGRLVGDSSGFDFRAEPAAIERFGLDSPVLSLAIPLAAVPPRGLRRRRENFFRELLPEGPVLERLARDAGVAIDDTLGILRRFGRDLAGALEIWDPDVPGEPRAPSVEVRSEERIAEMLAAVTDRPLGNAIVGGKTSLAGVQDKIVLARIDGGWHQVLDGWPSTHILKPASREHPTMIFDEAYGARLARAVGLSTTATWIEQFAGVPALVIERYDRSPDASTGRIHQEDFNQVLGASGRQKYQRYGGKVSLARAAAQLTSATDDDSLERLLRLVTLSVAVGNLDLHAKNVSILHEAGGRMTLAPAYDVVPQAHLPNDGEMAMAVGDEYRHAALTRAHLVDEALRWGMSEPAQIVDETLTAVLDVTATDAPDERAHPHLVDDITRFSENLLDGRAADPRRC